MRKKVRVLILCGGASSEREVSLKTGRQVALALPQNKYQATLVEITPNGKWLARPGQRQLRNGKGRELILKKNDSAAPDIARRPVRFALRSMAGGSRGGRAAGSFDVAFIGMHGKFGEDGKLQALLEIAGIPYTGSGVLASALAMNKSKTLEIVSGHGIRTSKNFVLKNLPTRKEIPALVSKIKTSLGFPCVVKPNESGSSVGVSIVAKKEKLVAAVRKAFEEDGTALIEKYIKGVELSCAVMGNTGQGELIAFPPVEIVPAGEFFDYEAKYASELTQEICPARISAAATKKIQKVAKKVHELLGCDGLTRSDFILDGKNNLYFLEINTIPGMTETSLVPKEAKAMGMSFSKLVGRQIQLALAKKRFARK